MRKWAKGREWHVEMAAEGLEKWGKRLRNARKDGDWRAARHKQGSSSDRIEFFKPKSPFESNEDFKESFNGM